MSDYSRVHDFSVKDALPSGDANKKIQGSEVDAELDAVATSNGTKANKVGSGTSGAYTVQDSGGDLADGGVVISGFVDTLLDDADAETARITLGVQSADNGSIILEGGTTAQRDGSPATGYFRYNTTLTRLEWYNGSDWVDAGGLAGLITTRGDLVRGDASGDPERYALGTDGQVLSSDGSDIVWADRKIVGTAQATTSGTEFDYTDLPGVNSLGVLFDAVSLSSTGAFLVQLGTAGGIVTSGYEAQYTSGAGGDTQSTAGFVLGNAGGAIEHSGELVISNVDGNDWVAGGILSGYSSDTYYGAGRIALAGPVTQLRVTRVGAATFDGGQINIIY